jgi:ABC-2 type transport system permease protein
MRKLEGSSMHNIWLIAKREYTERIKTKGFLIATILIPLLMGGGLFGVATLASKAKATSHIAVLTSQLQLADDLKQQLQNGKDSQMTVDILPASTSHGVLDQEMANKELDGYLAIVPSRVAGQRPTFDFKPRSTADIATSSALEEALHHVLTREYLAAKGVSESETAALMEPVTLNVIEGNGKRGDSKTSFYVAYTLFLLMYMVVLLYGMNVARSIIEEKTSRVFEVLLATITPDELLAGKIVGVGAVERGAGGIFCGVLRARLRAVFGRGGGAGSDDKLRAGAAAVEYVHDDPTVFQSSDAAADRHQSKLDAVADRIADSVLRAAADESSGFDFDAAALGDCAVDRVNFDNDLCGAVGVVADLSRGNFDVRQEAQSP